ADRISGESKLWGMRLAETDQPSSVRRLGNTVIERSGFSTRGTRAITGRYANAVIKVFIRCDEASQEGEHMSNICCCPVLVVIVSLLKGVICRHGGQGSEQGIEAVDSVEIVLNKFRGGEVFADQQAPLF